MRGRINQRRAFQFDTPNIEAGRRQRGKFGRRGQIAQLLKPPRLLFEQPFLALPFQVEIAGRKGLRGNWVR